MNQINQRTNIKHQFYSTSTILIKTFNSPPTLILGDQDYDRASYQIGISDLIHLITEGRLKHVSGSAQNFSKTSTLLLHRDSQAK